MNFNILLLVYCTDNYLQMPSSMHSNVQFLYLLSCSLPSPSSLLHFSINTASAFKPRLFAEKSWQKVKLLPFMKDLKTLSPHNSDKLKS